MDSHIEAISDALGDLSGYQINSLWTELEDKMLDQSDFKSTHERKQMRLDQDDRCSCLAYRPTDCWQMQEKKKELIREFLREMERVMG
jgi:hypothetical protein